MPTVVKYDNGVKLLRTEDRMSLIADPTTVKVARRSSATFITHGHTDHTTAFPNVGAKVYSTEIARDLFTVLTGKKATNTSFLNFHENTVVNDVEVKFIPAGHLLGAAQIIFYFNDKTILYTGDMCTEEMITVPQAELPEDDIDIVITEATYGDPNLFFESREKIKISLFQWIASNIRKKVVPVINIGHSGPMQEIIGYLNKMSPIEIYCSDKACELNGVYETHGINLNYKNFENDEKENFAVENSVVLLSRGAKQIPQFLESYDTTRAILTGQSVRFPFANFNKTFPFSMHSNAAEITEFVKKIDPKNVFTMYGFESELAAHIRRKLKIQSRPLKLADKNVSLEEFL